MRRTKSDGTLLTDLMFAGALSIPVLIAAAVLVGGPNKSSKSPRIESREILNQTEINSLRHSVADTNSARQVSYKGDLYTVYIVNVHRSGINLYWKDDNGEILGSPRSLSKYLEAKGRSLVFATNAGIYGSDQRPIGLYIENGKIIVRINDAKNKDGNFYLQPNGVFFIMNGHAYLETTDKFIKRGSTNGISIATQSGPMLISQGNINPTFSQNSLSRYVRSGVGIIDENSVVFAISNSPVSFYNFSSMLKEELGLKDALYLDGYISKMYLPKMLRFEDHAKFGAMFGVSLPENQAVSIRSDGSNAQSDADQDNQN